MISDFLQLLEYYSEASGISPQPYDDPLIRFEYEAIGKDEQPGLVLMAPFAHAINYLCYKEPGTKPDYTQKIIANVCLVSQPEVTAWKKEERIPEKYHWFLLLVDISANSGDVYGHKILHTNTQYEADNICDMYLRMVKCCFDPFCQDDCILAAAVKQGCGVECVKEKLLKINPKFWSGIFKIHSL